jgi:hypothetical protein
MFLVFTGRKWKNVMGESGITWEIAGIFDTDDANTACLAAAQETGAGTCFAVDGVAWGVDTIEADSVRKLGQKQDPLSRLADMGKNLEKGLMAIAESTQRQLPQGDDDDGE